MSEIVLAAVVVVQPFFGTQTFVSDTAPFVTSLQGLNVSCAPQITITATSPLQPPCCQSMPEEGAMARKTSPLKHPSMLDMIAPELAPSAKMRCVSTQ